MQQIRQSASGRYSSSGNGKQRPPGNGAGSDFAGGPRIPVGVYASLQRVFAEAVGVCVALFFTLLRLLHPVLSENEQLIGSDYLTDVEVFPGSTSSKHLHLQEVVNVPKYTDGFSVDDPLPIRRRLW